MSFPEIVAHTLIEEGWESLHRIHEETGKADATCPACVPAALIAETPERFDPPCEGDE